MLKRFRFSNEVTLYSSFLKTTLGGLNAAKIDGKTVRKARKRHQKPNFFIHILLANKIDGQHQKPEPNEMIPLQDFVFEKHQHKNREEEQRDNFLNHYQLPRIESV